MSGLGSPTRTKCAQGAAWSLLRWKDPTLVMWEKLFANWKINLSNGQLELELNETSNDPLYVKLSHKIKAGIRIQHKHWARGHMFHLQEGSLNSWNYELICVYYGQSLPQLTRVHMWSHICPHTLSIVLRNVTLDSVCSASCQTAEGHTEPLRSLLLCFCYVQWGMWSVRIHKHI